MWVWADAFGLIRYLGLFLGIHIHFVLPRTPLGAEIVVAQNNDTFTPPKCGLQANDISLSFRTAIAYIAIVRKFRRIAIFNAGPFMSDPTGEFRHFADVLSGFYYWCERCLWRISHLVHVFSLA